MYDWGLPPHMAIDNQIHSDIPPPRDRIVAAAERIFAAKGLHGAGLREIAREANVNVNLINWHFKNKDQLYIKIFEIRGIQINGMRQALLEKAEQLYAPGALPVREIIRAFIHPFFELSVLDPEIWTIVARSYMREMGTDVWRAVNAKSIAPTIAKFTEALHRSLPSAKRSEIIFILGLAIQSSMMAADQDEASIVGENLAAELEPGLLEERIIEALTAAAVRFA